MKTDVRVQHLRNPAHPVLAFLDEIERDSV